MRTLQYQLTREDLPAGANLLSDETLRRSPTL